MSAVGAKSTLLYCSKAASDPDEYIFFSLLKHSAVTLDAFFVGKFMSMCKLSQENPEIATEYFVFSVQLFLKSRRKERNSNHSAST